METFPALLALCAGNSLVTGEFPHKGQWLGTLMFSLICVWINGWVNNCEAGDLRRHRAHYYINVNVVDGLVTARHNSRALTSISIVDTPDTYQSSEVIAIADKYFKPIDVLWVTTVNLRVAFY